MRGDTITKNELEKAMCDLRKSHRLIYEYQDRMLQLMLYIRNRFSLANEIAGNKRFSNSIGATRCYNNEYHEANLKIVHGMWAWDFLYSYELEYYFGSTNDNKSGKIFSLSIVQISDTGYYESPEQGKTHKDTRSFADCESSSSVLIFVFEASSNIKKNGSRLSVDNIISTMLSSNGKQEIKHNSEDKSYVACRYDIHKFFNQETTDKILDKFAAIVKEQSGVNLLK